MGERDICVITGGRGFAARHLVLQTLRTGKWVVRIMDLTPQITLEEDEQFGMLGQALASGDAEYVCADLRVKSQVSLACKGASVVFHMASPDSSINSFKLHYDVTVSGTRNVINACIEHNIKKLIYTSSPSVVFDGIHDIHNGDEAMPYPDKHNDIYSEAKAQAEALVLAANGKSGLVTCALRPSSLFGPGDRLMVPSLVAAARSGKMKFIIGDGRNMCDFTYVENVAHAHICAEQALTAERCSGKEVAAGKAFFITNLEPMKFWDFISEILEGLGYQRPKVHLPVKVLLPLAYVIEWIYKQLYPFGMSPPQFTPSRIRLLTKWRTFNCDRAVKLLGYNPIVSLQEGIKLTIESYSHLRAELHHLKTRDLQTPSKACKMLGGGQIANILLWRNKKLSFVTVVAIIALIYFLSYSGQTFIFLVSRFLLVLTVALFLQGLAPSSICGYHIPKIPPTAFEVSDETAYRIASVLLSVWHPIWTIVEAMGRGPKNWFAYLKVIIFVQFLKFLDGFSFPVLLGTVVAVLFTAFYIYEQKEEEIDGTIEAIKNVVEQCKAATRKKVQALLNREAQEI